MRDARYVSSARPPRPSSQGSPVTSRSPRRGHGRIAEQTRQRLSGITPDGATRLVSLHDPDARPIRKGRFGKPVEFGYKADDVGERCPQRHGRQDCRPANQG